MMKILFYSTKDYEQPFLESAAGKMENIIFEKVELSWETAAKAKGFEAISIFTGDDASTPVLKELFKNGVRFIAIRAAGYDNVDLITARELGIQIANVPSYSPYAIAEHAFALILALNRRIITADKQVHCQNFTTGNLIGFDLHAHTLGIIGVGKIGSVLAKIAHGFGCRILGYDIHENNILTQRYGLEYVDLSFLCSQADIISIHTSLTPQTKELVERNLISRMKRGVMLINTSRGGCVNTADVMEGLENGHIGFFGADVYENERGIFFHDHSHAQLKDEMLKKLLAMPNVLITPHQAFATREALSNIATSTFYNIDCWDNHHLSKNELTMAGIVTEMTASLDDEES